MHLGHKHELVLMIIIVLIYIQSFEEWIHLSDNYLSMAQPAGGRGVIPPAHHLLLFWAVCTLKVAIFYTNFSKTKVSIKQNATVALNWDIGEVNKKYVNR